MKCFSLCLIGAACVLFAGSAVASTGGEPAGAKPPGRGEEGEKKER